MIIFDKHNRHRFSRIQTGHLLQDFSCPITLGQWEACDWTGKREAEQRAVGTENDSEEGSREGKMEADG